MSRSISLAKFAGNCVLPMIAFAAFIAFATGLCSCAIATFERLEITSNVVSYGQIVAEECVWMDFSGMPDKSEVEDLFELSCEGSSVSCDLSWMGKRASVSPETGWLKDKKYRIAILGTVHLSDGRRYAVAFERYFFWVSADGFLEVTGASPSNDSGVSPGEAIVVSFNMPVNVNSFVDSFSIRPYCDTRIIFSDGDRAVTVEPVSPWPPNEIFSWSLSGLLSIDRHPLPKTFESRFNSPVDVTIPEVIAVCPVTAVDGISAFAEETAIDGHLVDDQPFGIVFNEDMSPSSVLSALSIEPSLKGYFAKEESSLARYVFHPLEPYEAGVKYTLRVAASAEDSLGLGMSRDKTVSFTSLNKHLAVLSVELSDDVAIVDFSDPDIAHSHVLVGDALSVRVKFRSSIGPESRESAVGKIRVSPLFPSTASTPSLVAARWEDGGNSLVMEWKGFTRGVGTIDVFYLLSLTGGKSGITDGRGQYMEDDVCVSFKCL